MTSLKSDQVNLIQRVRSQSDLSVVVFSSACDHLLFTKFYYNSMLCHFIYISRVTVHRLHIVVSTLPEQQQKILKCHLHIVWHLVIIRQRDRLCISEIEVGLIWNLEELLR